MNRGKLLAAMCVTALALGTTPVWAQRAGSGSSGGTGSAVDRGSSSSSSPAPSSGSSSGGGSSSSGTSSSDGGSRAGSAYSPPSSSSGSDYVSVPVRPNQGEREQGGPRAGGPRSGGDSSARAVPRGSDGAAGSPSSTERRTAGAGSSSDSPSRNAVPTYSRPRDGRQGTGTAVDRPAGYYGGGGGGSSPSYIYRYPGYYGRYYYPGYAFGLGYFYDPSWYDPYYYGGLYGGGYGGYYGGGDYGGGGGGYQAGTGSSSYGRGPQGSLRLKIKPRDGQVFVDGFFVGTVDDFDGTFQRLGIDAGGHRIEIKAPGHETISFEVLITPNETVTYKGELPRIQ